jgi:hypothetical protein
LDDGNDCTGREEGTEMTLSIKGCTKCNVEGHFNSDEVRCPICGEKLVGLELVSTAELAALRDAKLIATHLLIDIQTFFNSEVKVCNGIGCEFEIGMLDSISAYLDSHGTEGNIKGDE